MKPAEWIVLIAVAAALALVAVRWWYMRPGLVDRLHRLGVQAMKTEEYEVALTYFERAINRDSMAFASRLNRGLVLMHLQHHTEARQVFDDLISDFPGYTRAMLGRAELAQRTGDTAAALADLTRALAIDPTLVDVYLQRAAIYTTMGDRDAALAALQQARELAPQAPNVNSMLAMMLLEAGDSTAAIRAVDQALRTIEDPNLHMIRARALHESNELAHAFNEYSRVILVQPTNEQALFERATVALQLRQWANACDDFSMILTLNPNLTRAYLGRAIAAKMLPDLAMMQADIDLVLRRDADAFEALHLRSVLHFWNDEWSAAFDDAVAAFRIHAPNAVATTLASQALRQQQRFEMALTLINEALTVAPTDSLLLQEWATIHAALKTPLDNYAPRLKDAIAQNPKDTELMNCLAWIYALEHKPVLALPYVQRMITERDEPWYRDTRAVSWALLDNLEASRADWVTYKDYLAQFATPYHQRIAAERCAWIAAIDAGTNPITPEVLDILRVTV